MQGPDQFRDVSDFQIRQLVFRLETVIPSDLTLLDDIVGDITAELKDTPCCGDVETIGLGSCQCHVHGNHCDPQKTVRVSVAVNENCDLLVSVKDSGSGFDPTRLPNPIAAENLLAPHGRGIFLIRQYMDEVDFKFDRGTEVRMRRRKK